MPPPQVSPQPEFLPVTSNISLTGSTNIGYAPRQKKPPISPSNAVFPHCLLEKFFHLLRNLSAVISPRQSFPSSTEHLEFGSIDKDAPAALRLLQSFSLYQQSTKLFTIIIYIRPRLWGEISGHAGVLLQH